MFLVIKPYAYTCACAQVLIANKLFYNSQLNQQEKSNCETCDNRKFCESCEIEKNGPTTCE